MSVILEIGGGSQPALPWSRGGRLAGCWGWGNLGEFGTKIDWLQCILAGVILGDRGMSIAILGERDKRFPVARCLSVPLSGLSHRN